MSIVLLLFEFVVVPAPPGGNACTFCAVFVVEDGGANYYYSRDYFYCYESFKC